MDEQKNIQRELCKKYIMLAQQLERWQEIFRKDAAIFAQNPTEENRAMMDVSTRHVLLNVKWKADALDRLSKHRAKYGDLMR